MVSSPIVSSPVVRKWPRLWSVVLWSCGLVVLLIAFCFVFRSPLLTGLANAWIVNEPVEKADAIVVLAGGLEYRPFAAAKLYRQGTAPKILITQTELPPTAQMGLTVPGFITTRQIMLSNGVPAAALQIVGTNVNSTRDEALALKTWVTEHNAHSLIIPTDMFHTRRVRWIFSKALRNTGTEVHVTAIAPPCYENTNWWKHEEGLIAFQNEVVKSLYYHLRY